MVVRVAPPVAIQPKKQLRWLWCGLGILLQVLNQGEVLRLHGLMATACSEAAARLGQNPHGEGIIYRGENDLGCRGHGV
jgi:hypothetical protein